jgi:hypothetical protein
MKVLKELLSEPEEGYGSDVALYEVHEDRGMIIVFPHGNNKLTELVIKVTDEGDLLITNSWVDEIVKVVQTPKGAVYIKTVDTEESSENKSLLG